jgi:hypothetical protein
MGSAQSHMEGKDSQPGMDEIFKDDPAWTAIEDLINQRSAKYTSWYRYKLRVRKLWRVRQCDVLQQQESQAVQLGEPTQLFHGTNTANALKIATSGFQLPIKKGMFGRGVYFAETPLKSAKFAPEDVNFIEHIQRFAQKGFQQGVSDLIAGRKERGQMLLCDVYLGTTKILRHSRNDFDPEIDLKGGWLRGITGLGDYHSAYAPGGWFGAVNVSEYIVYQPYQGVPKYMIEFAYDRDL